MFPTAYLKKDSLFLKIYLVKNKIEFTISNSNKGREIFLLRNGNVTIGNSWDQKYFHLCV